MATPLFTNLASLIGLNRAHGIDVSPTLLRVVTDLYVQTPEHPADDERQFVDMILSLADRVDEETAAICTAKLAAYPGLAPALAERFKIPARAAAAPAPAEPPAAPAADTPRADDPGERFLTSPADRFRILAELDTADGGIEPPADAPTAIRALETAALSGRPGDFIREIERSLSLPRTVAQRIVNDAGGEPTLVVAKALGMPIEVLQRVLLFVNPSVGQSVRRVFDLTALYDEVSRAAALRLVALWRQQTEPQRAAAPSARQPNGARDAATPSARPAPTQAPALRRKDLG